MKKKITKSFIFIFLLIITIPFFLVIFKVKVTPINKNDKKISLNFERDFPLKADLFKLYYNYKTNFLNIEPIPNSVIQAKNNWKFLGNKFSNALSESKGILVFTKKELNIIKKNLLDKKEFLDEKNIKFYMSIAPNKHTIYGEHIPIKKNNHKTKFQQIDSICKEIGVNFIDLGSDFPDKNTIQLYNKTDSHWNHLGGFYAFRATLNTIANDFKNVKFDILKRSDIQIETYPSLIGDLNRALFLKLDEEFIDIKLKRPFLFTPTDKLLSPPSNYHFNTKFYEERYTSPINNLKIMVLRDSFFGAYYQLIADNFGESVFLWWHNFDKELIVSEQPDILCYEIVERNIDILLSKNFNHSPD